MSASTKKDAHATCTENLKGKGGRELILDKAVKLFAEKGFNGVSLRDLAKAANMTPAALYHHFPNKHRLYLAALHHAYQGSSGPAVKIFTSRQLGSPEERLREFIFGFCKRRYEEPYFHKLLQRCKLESDEDVLELCRNEVFSEPARELEALYADLAPGFDKHLLATFTLGLVSQVYETILLRQTSPSYKTELDDPTIVTDEIMKLLLNGIRSSR